MRKILSATMALGALSLAIAGCDFANLMPKASTTKTDAGTNVKPTTDPGIQLQANLREAAAFSSNLREAAAFGTITNGPISALREAAAMQIQTTADFPKYYPAPYTFGTGSLVAVGSATASAATAMDVDVTITTATMLPTYVGTKIKGHFALVTTSLPIGLKGTGVMITTPDAAVKSVDFALITNPSNPLQPIWMITIPVASGSTDNYAHIEVNPVTKEGTGWVATGRDGTGKLGNLKTVNGKWLVAPLDNPDATASVDQI